MNKRTPINKLWAEKPAPKAADDRNTLLSNHQESTLAEQPAIPAATQPDSMPPSEAAGQTRKGQTLRLTRDAWKQLKLLAIEHDRTAHDLLIEAVNDLFRKHGKPPIA